MNILVIGGSYFVGKVFVERAQRVADLEICVLNRGNHPLRIEGVEQRVCDRNDAAQLARLDLAGPWDAVVDFCCYSPPEMERMLAALPAGSCRQYIYLSTASVHADSPLLPITETSPLLQGPQPELGPRAAHYAFNKLGAERALERICTQRGMEFTTLRPTIIYGKYNYAPRESYFFDLIRDRKIVYLPESALPLYSFVWVEDIAAALLRCLGNPAAFGRSLLLSAPECVGYDMLIEVLRSVTGNRIATRRLPVGELAARGIPLPFPLDQHLLYSGACASRVLDFEYRSFHEGMAETYAAYVASR